MEPRSILDDERNDLIDMVTELQTQNQELAQQVTSQVDQIEQMRADNEAQDEHIAELYTRDDARLADVEVELDRLLQENQRLTQRLPQLQEQTIQLHTQLLLAENKPKPITWIHRSEYKRKQLVPKAKPWLELEHDMNLAAIECAYADDNDESEEIKTHRRNIERIQRHRARQCEFVDYVMCQMAGGKEQRCSFLKHVLLHGPHHKEYQQEVPALSGISKARLLREAKEVLAKRNKRGSQIAQSAADREVIDAVYAVLLRSGITHQEILNAGIKDYGLNTKKASQKLIDGVPRQPPGRKQVWTQAEVDAVEALLKRDENSVEYPYRVHKMPDGSIKPVREYTQPLSAILGSEPRLIRPATHGERVNKHGEGRLTRGQASDGRISEETARKIVKTRLPWYKKARTKYFVCGHCDCRYEDATLLNYSPLPMYIIINTNTPREYEEENAHSRNLSDRDASTLIPEKWLPSKKQLNTWIRTLKIEHDEANKYREALERLTHTQRHYREKVHCRRVKNHQEIEAETTPGVVLSVSDHIASLKLGTKHRMTADQSMAGNRPPLMIFVQEFRYQDAADKQPRRTAFVVLSLTDDKSGWGIQEVEKQVYGSTRGREIMEHCICHRHWSDHGGSFPSEEVAGWLFGKLPQMFDKLQMIEFNTFASRHGKDRCDSVGSMIVQFLRERQTTKEGLQADLADIIKHLEKRIEQNRRAHNSDLEIVIIPWKPTQTRPDEYKILDCKNMRKSYSKRYERRQDGKSIITDQGLPNIDEAPRGQVLKLKPKLRKRRAKKKKPQKKKKPVAHGTRKLTEWADYRIGKAKQKHSVPGLQVQCICIAVVLFRGVDVL